MTTLYEILGADPDLSPAELRRAYLATIAEVHPDRARTGDEVIERTRLTAAVTAAWAVLGDPVARDSYDRSIGARRLPAPLRRLRRLASRLAQRRWVVGRPHPRIDLSPVRSAAGAWRDLLYETRLGQWSLVVLATGLATTLGGPTGGAAAGAAAGLLLAGAGEPTPLEDARSIAAWIGSLPRGVLRSFGAVAAGWLSPRLAETIERERRYGGDVASHLERTSRSIAREGERARPPAPAAWAPGRERRRPPRPPRRSGRPRSSRP
jgi:hypothetical protein